MTETAAQRPIVSFEQRLLAEVTSQPNDFIIVGGEKSCMSLDPETPVQAGLLIHLPQAVGLGLEATYAQADTYGEAAQLFIDNLSASVSLPRLPIRKKIASSTKVMLYEASRSLGHNNRHVLGGYVLIEKSEENVSTPVIANFVATALVQKIVESSNLSRLADKADLIPEAYACDALNAALPSRRHLRRIAAR